MKTLTVRDQSGKEFQVDEIKVSDAEKDGFLPIVTNGKETFRVAYNDLSRASEDGFMPFDVSDYSPEKIENTKQKKVDEVKSIGSKIMDNVVDPALTAIDYTYAPVRQAMAAPAKIAKGDYLGAFMDPITQLGKSPKEAPTSEQVAEMYGVPKEKKVSPIAVSNPLMGSTYEMNPDEDDAQTETIYPAAQAGFMMDAVLGGAGLNAVTKGVGKIAKGVTSGASKLADLTSPARSKAQTEAIIEAAKRIGVKVTPAMLDDTKFVQRLEYTLANSPSVLGQSIARKQEGVFKGMQKATEGLTSEATTLSPYDVGEKFKAGMTANVAERLDPISDTFNEISKNTKASNISPKSKENVIKNILNLDDYRLTEGAGKPQQYVKMLGRAENANDVKKIVSYINLDLKTVGLSGPEKFTLSQMKNKLLNLEKNTVTRAAIETARDLGMKGKEGEKIGKQLIDDLRGARKGYRELSTDISEISESARIKTNGPMDALDKIEKIPSENVQSKFFNVGNNRQLVALQSKFPEQFDLLKAGKLKDIAKASITAKSKGEASTAEFLKQVKNLNPEAQKMLFGGNTQIIDDLKTLQNSLPENFNPPGSATQQKWFQAWKENVADIPNYLLYRGATSNLGKKISEGATKVVNSTYNLPAIPDSLKSSLKDSPRIAGGASALLNSSGNKMLSVADLKGESKWANDGAQAILESESGIPKYVIESMMSDKKGKQLLIEASGRKPGTPAFNSILKKIRTGYLNKGDQ